MDTVTPSARQLTDLHVPVLSEKALYEGYREAEYLGMLLPETATLSALFRTFARNAYLLKVHFNSRSGGEVYVSLEISENKSEILSSNEKAMLY